MNVRCQLEFSNVCVCVCVCVFVTVSVFVCVCLCLGTHARSPAGGWRGGGGRERAERENRGMLFPLMENPLMCLA